MPDVEIVGVSKAFDTRRVLNQASAVFRHAEITCVVGASGSGKTTLARIVVGLDSDYSGDVRIGGRSVRAEGPSERGVSFLFQQPPLLAQRSVERNIATPLMIAGARAPEIDAAVSAVCGELDIEWLRKRTVSELSGGERQRVALARCLVRRSPLVVLDEPLKSAIEPELQQQIRSAIRRQQRDLRQTVVLVSHDPADVVALADAIASIGPDGKVVVQQVAECLNEPATITHADSVGAFQHVQYDSETMTLSVGGISIEQVGGVLPKGTFSVRARAESLKLHEGTAARVMRVIDLDSMRQLVEFCATAPDATASNSAMVTVWRQSWSGNLVSVSVDAGDLLCFDATGRRLDRGQRA